MGMLLTYHDGYDAPQETPTEHVGGPDETPDATQDKPRKPRQPKATTEGDKGE